MRLIEEKIPSFLSMLSDFSNWVPTFAGTTSSGLL